MATTKSASAELESVKGDLAALRGDVADLTSALLQKAKGKAAAAEDAVSEKVAEGKDALGELLTELRARTEDAADDVKTKVATNPMVSVLSAFGVGFLVGKLLDRS